MDKTSMSRILPVSRYRKGVLETGTESVVREVPVTLFLNDSEFVTLVCSPAHLKELAVGFLCSEGIVKEPGDLKEITIQEEAGFIWAETAGEAVRQEMFLKRHITTCCGRGRASFYFVNDARDTTAVTSPIQITPEELYSLTADLEERSALFQETGGAHSAALWKKQGLVCFFQDIGRHNAVDKTFGHCFLEGIDTADKILVVSGRISSEILIKTARMGLPLIVSRSAPTDLAVEMAVELGVTVVGFARGERLNVYSHKHRVVAVK